MNLGVWVGIFKKLLICLLYHQNVVLQNKCHGSIAYRSMLNEIWNNHVLWSTSVLSWWLLIFNCRNEPLVPWNAGNFLADQGNVSCLIRTVKNWVVSWFIGWLVGCLLGWGIRNEWETAHEMHICKRGWCFCLGG